MTDYERDKEYEKSEWWRVPLLDVVIPVAILICMWVTR